MTQGGGELLGPHDDIVLAHEEWGIDFGAGIAAIVDDLPAGATPDEAHGRIRLLMLANEVTLRNLMPDEVAKGGGPLHARPATGFSPVALTPDELGDAWRGGKLHLRIKSTWNGNLVGQPDAGADMAFNFPQLIAHLCKTRALQAGSIVVRGTGVEQGKQQTRRAGAGLFVHCAAAQQRNDCRRRAGHALHALRRHDPDRDGGREGQVGVRGDRAEGQARG